MNKNKSKIVKRTVSVNYPVGDFLIRLKNAAMAGGKEVVVSKSKFVKMIAELLKREKILDEVIEKDDQLNIRLAFRKKVPLLMEVKLVSKPGLRIYMGVDEIKKKKGPTFMIISTPDGVMSSKDAIKNNVGGEVVAEIL